MMTPIEDKILADALTNLHTLIKDLQASRDAAIDRISELEKRLAFVEKACDPKVMEVAIFGAPLVRTSGVLTGASFDKGLTATLTPKQMAETVGHDQIPNLATAKFTDRPEKKHRSYEERSKYACKVCGNVPDEDGVIEHGKGCYTQGGGTSWVEFDSATFAPTVKQSTTLAQSPLVALVEKWEKSYKAHASAMEGQNEREFYLHEAYAGTFKECAAELREALASIEPSEEEIDTAADHVHAKVADFDQGVRWMLERIKGK